MKRSVYLLLAILSCAFSPLFSSIIKFPPNGESKDPPYAELICTDVDVRCIHEIITSVAENSKVTLFFKQSHLKQLGAQINHVHPLKFLAAIFKDPKLRLCMREIGDDDYKWSNFMEGLAPNLTREADKGKLEQHLNSFATEIEINPDAIRKYFQNRDWESLVRQLMNSYD